MGMFTLLAIIILAVALYLDWQYETPTDKPVIIAQKRWGRLLPLDTGVKFVTVFPVMDTIELFLIDLFVVDVSVNVSTPDKVPLRVSTKLYLRADPNRMEKFFSVGKKEGVKNALTGLAEEDIRQWANNPNTEPLTWEQAIAAGDNLKKMLLDRLIRECGGNPEDTDEREKNCLKDFGVILDKVAIGEIETTGKIKEERELEAKEKQQRAAELADIKTKTDIANIVAEKLGISATEAFTLTQELEVLKAGHGSVFRVDASGLETVVGLAKSLFQHKRKTARKLPTKKAPAKQLPATKKGDRK